MNVRERLEAWLQMSAERRNEIEQDIARCEEKADSLRQRLLQEEEEALEVQVLLNLARSTGLKVERREDGMLVTSINDPTQATEEGAIQ